MPFRKTQTVDELVNKIINLLKNGYTYTTTRYLGKTVTKDVVADCKTNQLIISTYFNNVNLREKKQLVLKKDQVLKTFLMGKENIDLKNFKKYLEQGCPNTKKVNKNDFTTTFNSCFEEVTMPTQGREEGKQEIITQILDKLKHQEYKYTFKIGKTIEGLQKVLNSNDLETLKNIINYLTTGEEVEYAGFGSPSIIIGDFFEERFDYKIIKLLIEGKKKVFLGKEYLSEDNIRELFYALEQYEKTNKESITDYIEKGTALLTDIKTDLKSYGVIELSPSSTVPLPKGPPPKGTVPILPPKQKTPDVTDEEKRNALQILENIVQKRYKIEQIKGILKGKIPTNVGKKGKIFKQATSESPCKTHLSKFKNIQYSSEGYSILESKNLDELDNFLTFLTQDCPNSETNNIELLKLLFNPLDATMLGNHATAKGWSDANTPTNWSGERYAMISGKAKVNPLFSNGSNGNHNESDYNGFGSEVNNDNFGFGSSELELRNIGFSGGARKRTQTSSRNNKRSTHKRSRHKRSTHKRSRHKRNRNQTSNRKLKRSRKAIRSRKNKN
jgi:hypothetical protein